MSKQSDIAFRDQLLERLETHAATIESPEQAEQFRLAADKLQESITAYIDYGDTPELYFESSNAELELNVGESFASLFQISGTLSQEMGLEFQGLDRLGGHFEGAVIGVPHSRDEQQKIDAQHRKSLRMLILNEASNQVMREFNVAMDDLISNADDLNKNADNWFKAKEKVIEEFQDRLAVIDEKRNAFPKALIELRKNPTDEKIEAVIEDRKDYKKDLLEAKKRLDEELQNSKEYLEFYRGRKNEMLDGFERRIHRLKDWRLEREYRHLIEEFRKDEINPERVKEIKARIDQRLTEIPANSRDHEMVARMREFGEQIRPIGQRIRRIESCFRQNAAIIEDLLKEVDEHINELEAMKGLSLEEKQARIDALLEKVEDSLKNSHNLKNLRNELEAQRLQIVVDRANERQITSMSRLTDWFAQNVQGGKKVTLLNGEEAEVFQARSTKLYYTIENGKRVYVSGEDQLKLLGQDNISIEDMRADRKRREQEAAAAEAEEADKKAGLEIYKPHEDTQRPGSEFNAAVDNGDKTGPATAPVLEERATISGP